MCRLNITGERFTVANVLSRIFNISAVEQNLDLSYMPTILSQTPYPMFWGVHSIGSKMGCSSGAGLTGDK